MLVGAKDIHAVSNDQFSVAARESSHSATHISDPVLLCQSKFFVIHNQPSPLGNYFLFFYLALPVEYTAKLHDVRVAKLHKLL